MKFIPVCFTLFLSVACGQANNSGTGGNTAQGLFQAVCDLSNSTTSALVVCINFQINSTANQTSCSGGSEYAHYAAQGVSGAAYLTSSTANVQLSCLQSNSSPTVGTCALTDRSIVYYTVSWSVVNAQADCTARSGQWSN